MTGLPRSIIKKYGVTKKAWSVFRGERGTRTTKRRVTSMARFRKARRGHRRGFGSMGGIKGSLMGAAGAVAYDSFISPMIPLNGVTKDVAELAIGYYASKKGGIIGDTGKTLMVLNAYQLLSRIKLGGFGGSNGNSNVIG